MLSSHSSILALDIGGRRIGVASANAVARIAHPLTVLENNEEFIIALQKYIHDLDAAILVVGLPRSLEGQHTEQTAIIEKFIVKLKGQVTIPIHWQDEAVTSKNAEAELKRRGTSYKKGDIDALAATYILEDFLTDHPEIKA